ncbi:hypothetical protein Nepgr_005225 [Nepenthes gracilis]|uniref:Uncharacterized protein n=1 Tax=Nepenthes gracilis TaxID=150966 RepID=A0AAD3S2Y5_NEPGR|nr:hypothetical protein Nepgr_005225 [Nepenthes gracilis]
MNPSVIMGPDSSAQMASYVSDSDFPCLPTTKKVSFKVNSGVRESKVFAGIPRFPVTPVFQSDYVKGMLGAQHFVSDEISSLVSSGDSPFPLLDLEQNVLSNSARISASSHLCCEGKNTANTGCHRASSNSDPVDVVHAGILDSRVSEPDTGTVEHVCGHRQEILFAGSSQHHEHADWASVSLGLEVKSASMVSPVGMNHQSHNRNMNNVPSPGAQLGLSVERGDELKGLSWSSVVTKNTFGDQGTSVQPSPLEHPTVDLESCKVNDSLIPLGSPRLPDLLSDALPESTLDAPNLKEEADCLFFVHEVVSHSPHCEATMILKVPYNCSSTGNDMLSHPSPVVEMVEHADQSASSFLPHLSFADVVYRYAALGNSPKALEAVCTTNSDHLSPSALAKQNYLGHVKHLAPVDAHRQLRSQIVEGTHFTDDDVGGLGDDPPLGHPDTGIGP